MTNPSLQAEASVEVSAPGRSRISSVARNPARQRPDDRRIPGPATGSPAVIDHRYRLELGTSGRLRRHRTLADGSVQREDAGRPRSRASSPPESSTGSCDPIDGRVPSLPRSVGQAGAEQLYVLATAAAREAENGPDFIRRAEAVLGTEIRVLSGREEAYYSALGVISGFHSPTASPAISAAAALNWSTSTARGSATASPCRWAACACRTWRRTRCRPARSPATSLPGKAPEGRAGRAFYAVGGTWRNLARLHMNVTIIRSASCTTTRWASRRRGLPQAGGARRD